MKVNSRSLCQLRSSMFLSCRKVMCGAANFIIMLYDLLYVPRPRRMETFIFICWKTSYLRSWRKNKFTFFFKKAEAHPQYDPMFLTRSSI